MRKKALATGLTWVVAITIIFFFSIIFLSAVLFLNKSQIIFGKENNAIKISQNSNSNIILEKNFQSFLNRKVVFENEQITILELVEKNEISSGKASELFKEQAKLQFEKVFPYPTEKWSGISQSYGPVDTRRVYITHPYWITAYDKNEKVEPRKDSEQTFAVGGTDCIPFQETSITLIRFTENKKVVLCVNQNYYKTLEGNK